MLRYNLLTLRTQNPKKTSLRKAEIQLSIHSFIFFFYKHLQNTYFGLDNLQDIGDIMVKSLAWGR